MAFISYLIAPAEFPPRYGLDHQFRHRRPGIPSDDCRGHRRHVPGREPHRHPEQRRQLLPGDARGRQGRGTVHHHRGVHLLGGRDRARVREGVRGEVSRRGPRQDPARRGRVEQRRRGDSLDPGVGTLPAGLVQPDQAPHPRTVQPQDAPQVAHRGWAHRVHRRRRDCRPLAGGCPEPERVARHADSARGAGGRPAAERLRAELAQTTGELVSGPLFYPEIARPAS